MTFDEYQKWTKTTAIYRSDLYPQLALAEEVGELLGKLAKFDRKYGLNEVFEWEGRNEAQQQLICDVRKEAGDILWQLARLLDDMGISLASAAQGNVDKLESRKERNVINGSGDNR